MRHGRGIMKVKVLCTVQSRVPFLFFLLLSYYFYPHCFVKPLNSTPTLTISLLAENLAYRHNITLRIFTS